MQKWNSSLIGWTTWLNLRHSGSTILYYSSTWLYLTLIWLYLSPNCILLWLHSTYLVQSEAGLQVEGYHCCKSWSAQACKLLEMYTCCQASTQACIHLQCTRSGQAVLQCTRSVQACTHAVHKLGTGLGTCAHFQAVSKLGHSNFYSSVFCTISSLRR